MLFLYRNMRYKSNISVYTAMSSSSFNLSYLLLFTAKIKRTANKDAKIRHVKYSFDVYGSCILNFIIFELIN